MSRERSRARSLALQALYQRELADTELAELLGQFRTDPGMPKADGGYFEELVRGVSNDPATLDVQYGDFVDRPAPQLDPIERSLLRMGTWELAQRLDVPYRVVLNEYIELAKRFGGEAGHTYINAALDRVARSLRKLETGAR